MKSRGDCEVSSPCRGSPILRQWLGASPRPPSEGSLLAGTIFLLQTYFLAKVRKGIPKPEKLLARKDMLNCSSTRKIQMLRFPPEFLTSRVKTKYTQTFPMVYTWSKGYTLKKPVLRAQTHSRRLWTVTTSQ